VLTVDHVTPVDMATASGGGGRHVSVVVSINSTSKTTLHRLYHQTQVYCTDDVI